MQKLFIAMLYYVPAYDGARRYVVYILGIVLLHFLT